MSVAKSEARTPSPPTPAREEQGRWARVARRGLRAIEIARARANSLTSRLPGAVHGTQARARDTTKALQTLPDPMLRSLAATSLGLGAGFHLAGAPRLVTAAGLAPAVLMGAAMVLRPIEPAVAAEQAGPSSASRQPGRE